MPASKDLIAFTTIPMVFSPTRWDSPGIKKLGKHFIIEPLFRFYEQSSASFYSTAVPISFSQFLSGSTYQDYNSSDYRLSNFYSLDYGLQATVVINDHIRFIAGYHRYEMNGLDNTPENAYPKANIFSVGLSLLW